MATTNEIELFTKTQKDLEQFKVDFANVPDATTPDGYAFIKSACSTLTKARIGIEKVRKSEKQYYIDAGKAIDAQAKAITVQIEALEGPMKDAKTKQDNAEAIAKAERINRLKGEVNKIALHVNDAKGKSSHEILEVIEAVKAIDTANGFYDLTTEATQCRAETLETLEDMYSVQFSFEDQETQRIEAEAKAEKLERANNISERINKLQQIPLSMFGKSSEDIQSKIDSVKKHDPTPEDFDDRYKEAEVACKAVLIQLDQMLSMAVMAEQQQAQAPQPEPEPEIAPEPQKFVNATTGKAAPTLFPKQYKESMTESFNEIVADTNFPTEKPIDLSLEGARMALRDELTAWAEDIFLGPQDIEIMGGILSRYGI